MMQFEFESRTGVSVALDEYSAIEKVYMESDLDKDEFCKMWCKMNAGRIRAARKAAAEKMAKEKETARLHNILSKLECRNRQLRHDTLAKPLSINFLSGTEVRFLQAHGINMEISYQEAVNYGYLIPRHYDISETAYHIRKYLKIV